MVLIYSKYSLWCMILWLARTIQHTNAHTHYANALVQFILKTHKHTQHVCMHAHIKTHTHTLARTNTPKCATCTYVCQKQMHLTTSRYGMSKANCHAISTYTADLHIHVISLLQDDCNTWKIPRSGSFKQGRSDYLTLPSIRSAQANDDIRNMHLCKAKKPKLS